MNRLFLIAGALAFLGACSSGGGCDGGEKKAAPAGESTSLPGGASSHGGTSETVSFQGMGKKTGGTAAQAAAAALGGSGAAAPADPPQSVICGGFPYLAADCKSDPLFAQVQKKCCPTGTVDTCQSIPGGARLIGHGCTPSAAAK
ncbi:MAG: hypothetical protein ACHQ2Z_03975 [Elusimicrobiota bacterium]